MPWLAETDSQAPVNGNVTAESSVVATGHCRSSPPSFSFRRLGNPVPFKPWSLISSQLATGMFIGLRQDLQYLSYSKPCHHPDNPPFMDRLESGGKPLAPRMEHFPDSISVSSLPYHHRNPVQVYSLGQISGHHEAG